MITKLINSLLPKDPLKVLSRILSELDFKDLTRFQYAINNKNISLKTQNPYSHYFQWNDLHKGETIITVSRESKNTNQKQLFHIELWQKGQNQFQGKIELSAEQSNELVINLNALSMEMNAYALDELIKHGKPIELSKQTSESLKIQIQDEAKSLEWLKVSLEVLKKSLNEFKNETTKPQDQELLLESKLAYICDQTTQFAPTLSFSPLSLEFRIKPLKNNDGLGPIYIEAYNYAKNLEGNAPDMKAYFIQYAPDSIQEVSSSIHEVTKIYAQPRA